MGPRIAVVAAPGTSIGVAPDQLATPQLSLFAFLALFGGLATFLSMALPSRRLAASVAGLILVAGFMITMIPAVSPDLEPQTRYLPLVIIRVVRHLQV